MDRTEFERLTTKYLDRVYRFCLSCVNQREDAEDLTQNTFLKLWKSDQVFADDESVKRWLIRVAVNESRDLFRSPWKKRRVSLEDLDAEPAVQTKEHEEIIEAVWNLPVKYRQVIYLYYFEGYKAGEIAQILGRSETAVQTQLQRGRHKLREQLEKEHE